MKYLFFILFPCMVFGQIHYNKMEATNQKNEYKVGSVYSHFEVLEKGKLEDYTIIDGEFTALLNKRQVDTTKSISIAFDKDRKDKQKINLVDSKGKKIKIDPEKESKKSAVSFINEAIKNGYKKDKSASVGDKTDK